MNSHYPTNDLEMKNYVEVLEQTIKDFPKGLPKGYSKIKSLEERAEVLQGRLFKKLLNRKSFYKLTEK